MNDQVPDVPCIIFQHNFLQKLFQLISLSFYKLYKNKDKKVVSALKL